MRVGDDVVDGGGQAGVLAHFNDALGGQQLQGAGLVGGVVGHRDDRAVRDGVQAAAFARVDAERFVVDVAHADQVGAVFLIERIEVLLVLEVVGVHLAVFGHHIGLDIVAELDDLEFDALLSQNLFGNFQDFGMRRGRGGHFQGRAFQAAGLAGRRLGRSVGRNGRGGAAAGQGEGQRAGQDHRQKLFHKNFSFSS